MFIRKLMCALIEQVVITNPHKTGAWVYMLLFCADFIVQIGGYFS